MTPCCGESTMTVRSFQHATAWSTLLRYVEGASMSCRIDHSGEVPASIGRLEESQAGFWRHRCAGCAYLMGRHDAQQSEARLRGRVQDLEAQLETLKVRLEPSAQRDK